MYILILSFALIVQGLGLYSLFFKDAPGRLLHLTVSFILSGSVISLLFNVAVFIYVPFIYFAIAITVLSLFYFRAINLPNCKLPDRKLIIYFLILLITATSLFIGQGQRWGKWDAWAIWNAHAKFLYDEQHWSRLFFGGIAHSHPDYPLMLPSIVAMLWKAVGSVTPYVPFLIAMIVFFCILLILFSSINDIKYKYFSLLGLTIISIDLYFIKLASSQYADTLLSLYILITTILIWYQKSNKPSTYIVIGLFASLCLWVKNEGVVYFAFISLFIFLNNLKGKKRLLNYLLGISPIVLLYIIFKIYYAPSNLLVTEQGSSTFEKLISLARYKKIVKHLILIILINYPILPILFAFIIFTKKKNKMVKLLMVLLCTFMVYLGVYLITPFRLDWHLRHSLDRLIHQLYPSLLFCFLVILQTSINKGQVFKSITKEVD